MNKVMLVGRLVRDPDLHYSKDKGTPRAFLVIATKGYYNKKKGETVDDFIPVTIWGKRAETLAQHAKKGWAVELEGRLKSGSYKDDQGKTVYKLEFVADNFEFIARPKGEGK